MQGQRHRSCQTSCYCTHACSLLPRISRRWLLNRCEQSYSTVPDIGLVTRQTQHTRFHTTLDALEILPLHLSAFYASLHINYASSAHLYGLPRIPDEFAAPSCRALTTAVAPSNRIGPIACQASSFASARSLRRHCRADRFFHELSKIATLLWRCQSQHLVNDRRYCATS
ncbi:hypothetical protein TgHK011_009408 [Trichoderma gracile]|nr:hypothetical protein TgHK011_009408 [Trichoderma gracile]